MQKIVLYLIILIFITSCSVKKEIGQKNFTFSTCVNSSYTKKNKDLFIEYINLDISCSWAALPRTHFIDLYKESLDMKTFELIERYDYENKEFNTYKIDGKYYINLIWESRANEEKFILDTKGLYFHKELRKYKNNYKNLFLSKERYKKDYNHSLVEKNLFNRYFVSEIYEDR